MRISLEDTREPEDDELPCYRETDGDGWQCVYDHTGCIYNDGHNTCWHEGDSTSPLEDPEQLVEELNQSAEATQVFATTEELYPDLDNYDFVKDDLNYDAARERR